MVTRSDPTTLPFVLIAMAALLALAMGAFLVTPGL